MAFKNSDRTFGARVRKTAGARSCCIPEWLVLKGFKVVHNSPSMTRKTLCNSNRNYLVVWCVHFFILFFILLLLLVKEWRRLVKLYLSYSDCFSHIWVARNSFHLLGIRGHSDFTVWGFRIYSGLQCWFAGLPTTREYVTTSLRPLQHSFLRSHSLSTSMTRRVQVPSAFSSLCCCDFVCVLLFSSVQDGIPMLGRAHMLSNPISQTLAPMLLFQTNMLLFQTNTKEFWMCDLSKN